MTMTVALAAVLVLSLVCGLGFVLWSRDRQRRDADALAREQALRDRERRTRQLFDDILNGSADAIFAKDTEGRYLLANRAHAERLGLGVEQLQGRRDDELLPPEVAAVIREVDRRVLAGESFVNVEQRLALPIGEHTYLTTKAVLRDADGEVIGLYGIARDVSERKRSEADLRAAEASAARLQGELRWKDALEAAGHGVWDWDVDSGLMNFSPTWKRMLGYEDAEIGTDLSEWSGRVHPDDLAATQAAVQCHLAGQTSGYTSVHRMRCKDGSWKWILDCGAVFERDSAGKPRRMLGTHTDITAQRLAEERLRETEAQVRQQWIELEAIYTTAPIGLFVLDRELRFLRLNERLAEINGLPVSAHLGRRVREIVPDLADAAEPLFQGVIDRGEPLLNVELSGETTAHPGVPRYWREQFYPMRDASGRVVGINGVVEEITEIKRVEEEIRALNADLEAKVEARTAEARAASAAKSEFLAHMSHEIRTPLNAVLGLIQALEQSSLSSAQRELIGQVRGAGRSLLLLLNDILDFSKIEAGQLQLETRPFVLAPLLGQLDALLGSTARAKGLSFVARADSLPDGALVGDPLRLEQVLTNLIGNAVKFTDRGEVRVVVRTQAVDERSARLRFEVIDTGIGIAPDVLARLFAAFSQADSGISRRFGGTGLGLAISKRLVECMGGEIGVESREGAGSVFWFELPFPRAAETPEFSVLSLPLGAAARGPRLSGGRYLIVDDNALNLDVLERMLELEGARVTRAGDGRTALARLRTGPSDFDAVLMDVQMPVLDGLSATRAIRGELGLARLPVIAVTAGVLKEEQQRARDAGMDAVLPKPVEQDHLVEVLSRWPRRSAPALAAGVDSSAPPVPAATRQPADFARESAPLPVIEGIDQAHVARLTRGDLVFFRRLLSGLVTEVREAPAQVRAALAHGAVKDAAARLHRLRGVAANMGALDLVAAIRTLETPLHEPRPVLPVSPEAFEAFEARVAALLASADHWLARTEPTLPALPTEAAVGKGAELDPTRLAELRAALASSRPRPARQRFAELRSGLSLRYGSAMVDAMDRHLAVFDFPAALSTLDGAMSDMADRPGAASEAADG